MSIIGQPESYSDMLKRIFFATVVTGILCSIALAAVSPEVHAFFESWDAEVNFIIFTKVKPLYILIPSAAAGVSRFFLLQCHPSPDPFD